MHRARASEAWASALSFRRVAETIRRLQWVTAAVLGLVVVLPASLYAVEELNHLRAALSMQARHSALLVQSEMRRPDASFEQLRRVLSALMDSENLALLRLLDAQGQVIFEMGEPPRGFFAVQVEARITGGPLHDARLSLGSDWSATLQDMTRVLGIHMLVAIALGGVLHGLPVRAVKQAVAEVQASEARLLQADKLAAIGKVYAGLTHEINNPLSILLSRVKLMLDTARMTGLSAETVRDLEVVERHGNRIAEIVRGFLAFVRKAPLERAPVDLNRCVEEAAALVGKGFDKQAVRIEADLAPALPLIVASANQIQQVLVNFLNNARDAMAEGGTIRVRTACRDGSVLAEVSDGGKGMSADEMRHVFEPFYTTKPVGHGTGLGLSVSYGIATAHGGDIELESSPGQGSTFRLRLPASGAA
jgi:signal transduction histidine kinase